MFVSRLAARLLQTSLHAEPAAPPSPSKEALAVSPVAEVSQARAGTEEEQTEKEQTEKRKTRGRKRKAETEEVSHQVGEGSCRRSLRKKIKF